MAVLASALADHLRRKDVLSTTQIRKIFTTFATMIPGLLMVVQCFCGYNHTWSVVIFTLQLLFNGAVTAGYLGNGLDIAPNFSGTIFGLANTLSSMSGYLSSLMIGELTSEKVYKSMHLTFMTIQIEIRNLISSFFFLPFCACSQQTYGQWQIVFAILAATYILGSFAFLLMGSGELQPWNNPPEPNQSQRDAEEALPLKKENIISVN